jgi:general secretion pathway protein A
MYVEFFQLKDAPFSIAPDPRYLFMSERHREALAHLLYGVTNGNGFVALTGEVGTGKTTLCNCLVDQLPAEVDLALVLNPRVNAEELLATVCDELEIAYPKGTNSLKVLVDALTAHLLRVHALGRNTVLLIDEAQNLSIDVLEQIRLLTNLETHDTKLLQIILVGQPELNQLLAQKNLRQLNQRITARYHIDPLSLSECAEYIDHRLKVAGSGSHRFFSKRAVQKVFRFSGGIPRLVNIICERAMLGAYSLGARQIGPKIVRQAAGEVLLPRPTLGIWSRKSLGIAISASLFGALLFLGFLHTRRVEPGRDPGVAAEPAPTSPTKSDPQSAPGSRIFKELFAEFVPLTEPGIAVGNTNGLHQSPASLEVAGSDPAGTGKQSRIRFVDAISTSETDINVAVAQLFRQWNVTIEPRSTQFCESAWRAGLRCLVQQGTWHYLLTLNRPATLEFALQHGVTRHATLIGVDRETATFAFVGSDPTSFPVNEVLSYWQGKFVMLWRPPAPEVSLLVRGYSNPAVTWLRDTLSSIRGTQPANSTSIFFDEELEKEVIDFQSNHGLKPDGKVGAETIIVLNNVSNAPNIPKLTPKRNQSCPTC